MPAFQTAPGDLVGPARANLFPLDAPVCGVRRLVGYVLGVNLNSANTDFAVPLLLLASSNFIVTGVYANNASTSLTTATAGVFPAAAGAGTAIVAAAALSALTAASVNLSMTLNAAGSTNVVLNSSTLSTPNTLYVRCGTAQGAPATADFYIYADVLI